jgi:xanthine dehydrogenase accessory factor
MKDLLPTIKNWMSNGQRLVLARVMQTWGSSPRPAGSSMIISEKLEMAGSVSGGCVESTVLKEAKRLLEGDSCKKLSYGVTDEEAWTVGLSCGGKIDVFIQPWFQNNISEKIMEWLEGNENFILVTSLTDGSNSLVVNESLTVGQPLSSNVVQKSVDALNSRVSVLIHDNYLIQTFPHRSRMIIIGAAHVTSDLVKLAKEFDFETIVIDPRGAFARNTNFIQPPDQIIEKYPSEVLKNLTVDTHTYAVILSHDPKIDDDALRILLRSNAAYIGALGSKKNHEKRTARLLADGFSEAEIARINAPIGIDINALGAKEIALSILAAIIKKRNENLKK